MLGPELDLQFNVYSMTVFVKNTSGMQLKEVRLRFAVLSDVGARLATLDGTVNNLSPGGDAYCHASIRSGAFKVGDRIFLEEARCTTEDLVCVSSDKMTGIDEREITNSVGMRLVKIAPGEFVMGSPAGEEGRNEDETQHRVKLTEAYYLGAMEVTQAQWKAVMGENPSGSKCDDLPVENVSWTDAVSFCARLSAKEGKRYRLPTEAEWEYACRGGSADARYGPVDDVAWHDGNSRVAAHPVAQKEPNAYGFYDMLGNVWEWCSDLYGNDAGDPTGLGSGDFRVLRGGSWCDTPSLCRAALRNGGDPSYQYTVTGFRVARDP